MRAARIVALARPPSTARPPPYTASRSKVAGLAVDVDVERVEARAALQRAPRAMTSRAAASSARRLRLGERSPGATDECALDHSASSA